MSLDVEGLQRSFSFSLAWRHMPDLRDAIFFSRQLPPKHNEGDFLLIDSMLFDKLRVSFYIQP